MATEEFNRQDYYLAQIAADIERGHVKNPSRVTIQKKLIQFTTKDQRSLKDKEAQLQQSKNFWLAMTGASAANAKRKRRLTQKTLGKKVPKKRKKRTK